MCVAKVARPFVFRFGNEDSRQTGGEIGHGDDGGGGGGEWADYIHTYNVE